jgi:hypothetical protein
LFHSLFFQVLVVVVVADFEVDEDKNQSINFSRKYLDYTSILYILFYTYVYLSFKYNNECMYLSWTIILFGQTCFFDNWLNCVILQKSPIKYIILFFKTSCSYIQCMCK